MSPMSSAEIFDWQPERLCDVVFFSFGCRRCQDAASVRARALGVDHCDQAVGCSSSTIRRRRSTSSPSSPTELNEERHVLVVDEEAVLDVRNFDIAMRGEVRPCRRGCL
jgi:hypothetical protein